MYTFSLFVVIYYEGCWGGCVLLVGLLIWWWVCGFTFWVGGFDGGFVLVYLLDFLFVGFGLGVGGLNVGWFWFDLCEI